MATATPDTLLETLVQLVTAAADEAANQPGQIGDVLDQAFAQAAAGAQEVAALPAALLHQLDQAVHPPDWFSLLVFVLLELSKLDGHLSVGALAASNGWSRAVALTYRADQTPNAPSATVALALTDPATTHGVIFRIAGLDQVTFNQGPVSVSITGQGDGEWRIPFSGGIQPPAQAATISCTLSYGPVLALPAADKVGIGVGSARVSVALSTNAPIWHVEAGIGDEAGIPGVEARVSLRDALGPLAAVLAIQPVDEKYSPKVSAGAGTAPAFSLGHGS